MKGNKKTLNDSERLDNLSGPWRRGENLPLALHGMPVVSLNRNLYLLGGSERAGAIVNRRRSSEPLAQRLEVAGTGEHHDLVTGFQTGVRPGE